MLAARKVDHTQACINRIIMASRWRRMILSLYSAVMGAPPGALCPALEHQLQGRHGCVRVHSEDSSGNHQRDRAPMLSRQVKRVGVIHLVKQKIQSSES